MSTPEGVVAKPPTPYIDRAPSVLLQGPIGTGKSHSLVTIMQSGWDIFNIVTEPNGLETLVNAMRKYGVPPGRLHYRVIEPAREGFDSLMDMARKVTTFNFEALSKMAPQERSKSQFLEVVATFGNFIDDRTGMAFGPVHRLPPRCAVVLDSLSGLNLMAMDLTIGDKVTAHQGEWGVAMSMIDKLLLSLTSNLKCMFVLTAHVEREQDDTTLRSKLMTSTLGRKLAPKIPRFFSEVVLTSTEGGAYWWNTVHPDMDLKHRALQPGAKLIPTFKPIIDAYEARLQYLNQGPNT